MKVGLQYPVFEALDTPRLSIRGFLSAATSLSYSLSDRPEIIAPTTVTRELRENSSGFFFSPDRRRMATRRKSEGQRVLRALHLTPLI